MFSDTEFPCKSRRLKARIVAFKQALSKNIKYKNTEILAAKTVKYSASNGIIPIAFFYFRFKLLLELLAKVMIKEVVVTSNITDVLGLIFY